MIKIMRKAYTKAYKKGQNQRRNIKFTRCQKN